MFDLVDEKVASIIERSGGSEVEIYLTGPFNFRIGLASLAPYKGTRAGNKPYHWETVGRRLKERWNAIEVLGIEADDMLAIRATEVGPEYIIASRDKDLRQVPCKHFSWKCGENQPERPTYDVDYLGFVDYEVYVSPKGDKSYKLKGYGLRFFYGQLLVGDTVDNIKGCPRVGPKLATELLQHLTTEAELLEQCKYQYQQKFKDWEAALVENARLLYLIRDRSWIRGEPLGQNKFMYHVEKFWEIPNDVSTHRSAS